MNFEYVGHACVRCIANDGQMLIIDPPKESYGYPIADRHADYVTCSHKHGDHGAVELFPVSTHLPEDQMRLKAGPFLLERFPCWHDNQGGTQRGANLVHKITADGITFVHLGDLGHWPDENLKEFAAGADLLALPVGGVFTLTLDQLSPLIRLLQPSYVLPIHYRTAQGALQQLHPLEDFLSCWDGEVLRVEHSLFELTEKRPREPVVLITDFSSRVRKERKKTL